MSTATLSAPVAQPAVFPPPSVPLRFTDGDRYEWPGTGDVWVRTGGFWEPTPDDGSGYLTDPEVRANLRGAVVNWDVKHRFAPVLPKGHLPGLMVRGIDDLERLWGYPTDGASQYLLDHRASTLVPLRDLVAAHDLDMAYDLTAKTTVDAMLDVLGTIQDDHRSAQMSYDESAGRVYARYWRKPGDGRPVPAVRCLHVFVLSAASWVV